jgi:hypothetical protein
VILGGSRTTEALSKLIPQFSALIFWQSGERGEEKKEEREITRQWPLAWQPAVSAQASGLFCALKS